MSKLGRKLTAAAKEGVAIARAEAFTPLKTKRDHRRALKEIEGLMGAKRGTPDGDRLDLLVTLVEAFEAKHYLTATLTKPKRNRQSGIP
jgi:hypothetical protein